MSKTFSPQSPTSKTPYHKAGKMELAHVPSEHAHRIIAGAGVGDTGSASSKNKSDKAGC